MTPPSLSAEEIREVNARYHDVAARDYDFKWGIDFGDIGAGQVLGKLRKGLDGETAHFARGLEIGAGTGYFGLNLQRAGVVGEPTCIDISAGMLAALAANADRLGLEVHTRVADAEQLPFEDESFDLVFGHAVLHHIPDLPRAFAEFRRVLRPKGSLFFAGEPSRQGDRLAAIPKRAGTRLAPAWRRAMGAREAVTGHGECAADHALEGIVDVHAFLPGELRALAVRAGLERVRVVGEELLANWFGWTNRTLEATARPEDVPWLWRQYAYRGYLLLQEVDRRVLESRLPAGLFYNLMLSARRGEG